MRQSIILLAAAGLLTLSGCSAPDVAEPAAKVPPGGVLLKGAGATFPSLLYKKWIAEYQSAHPQTAITYASVGSGEGVRRFIGVNVKQEEQVDFGASDAALTDEEISRVSQGVILVPATAGAVVLAYNLPDISGDLRLSREAYSGIFLGDIRNWNDPRIAKVNPGLKLPKLTIAPVVRLDSSGTTFAFTKHLDAVSAKWRGSFGAATLVSWPGEALRAKGNEGVAATVQRSNGSIGYVGYEFARRLGLKMALLENHDGKFVAPSPESASAALAAAEMPSNRRLFVPDPIGNGCYPIVTFSWILIHPHYDNPEKQSAMRDFLAWALQDGQKLSLQLGYIPIPQGAASSALAALNPSPAAH